MQSKLDLSLINQLGQTIVNKKISTVNLNNVSFGEIPNGLYQIRVTGENVEYNNKIQIIK